MRWLYAWIFKHLGWRVIDRENLPNASKYILLVAPHTSNWDFLVGVGARAEIRFYPRYLAKKELFIWPLGWLFRRLGGYPVERKNKTNFVEQLKDIFNRKDSFILTITPEGTRSFNPNWRTGFFYLAQQTGVPIVPVAFDYSRKEVVIGEAKHAEGQVEPFIQELKTWYSQFKGKLPENGVRLTP